jgi:predicted DsbA family dithiol-disulfide isomerase
MREKKEVFRDALNAIHLDRPFNKPLAHESQTSIRGVPFFIFNDRSAVSGAQCSDVFLQALEKSWAEYEAAAAR